MRRQLIYTVAGSPYRLPQSLDLAEIGPSTYGSFRPKADVSEGSFRPLEIYFLKTKFAPSALHGPVAGHRGPVGTASRLVALEEDRYAQCV